MNIDKSTLIDLSAARFDSLIWQGKRLTTGHGFRRLGYPIGVNVSHKMLINWVIERVKGKILYWKSDEWPMHVRLRIIQSIIIPYFLYYLPLLGWRDCHLQILNSLLRQFLWNKTHKKSMVLISWDTICQPHAWGGMGITHVATHM